jgi:hypothetical protein
MPHVDQARVKAHKHIADTQHKHLLEQLPALNAQQAQTLAANPDLCNNLMEAFKKVSGDEELFHEWLKKEVVK